MHATVDAALSEDAARVQITLRGGTILGRPVEHAIGSLARPMSDADLEAKFRGLCGPVLEPARIEALSRQCWNLDALASAGALARMTVPD